MKLWLRDVVCFVGGASGILMAGTAAIAIPVAARSGCAEIAQTEPPVCLDESVPGLWSQSGQALALAIGCWLVAGFVIPVLATIVIRCESYIFGMIITLSLACGLGYRLGDGWMSDRSPERYLADSDAALIPLLGFIWTFGVTTPILSGMIKGISLEDLQRRTE